MVRSHPLIPSRWPTFQEDFSIFFGNFESYLGEGCDRPFGECSGREGTRAIGLGYSRILAMIVDDVNSIGAAYRLSARNARIVSKLVFESFITERRDCLRRAIMESFGSCLICSKVTGGATGVIGRSSTAYQSPSVAVGSGNASFVTLAIPTTAFPTTL